MHRNIRKLSQEAQKFFGKHIYEGFPFEDLEEVQAIAREEAGGQDSTLVLLSVALEIGFTAGRQYEQGKARRASAAKKRRARSESTRSQKDDSSAAGGEITPFKG